MRKLTLPLMLASCGAGLAFSPSSHAISFGVIKVHSYLEQPLDASVSYSNNPADGVKLGDGSCIEIDKEKSSDSGLPVINRIQIQVDGTEQSGVLRIRSLGPIGEPVAVIRLRNRCDQTGNIVREFTFFLDPQPEVRIKGDSEAAANGKRINLPQATPQARVKRQIDVPTKEIWTVKRGDTLTRIARHFQPDPAQQKAMAKAILASNPSIKSADLIDVGQKLTIPDLTVLYAANAVNPDKVASAKSHSEKPAKNRDKRQDPEAAPPPATRHAGDTADDGSTEYKLKLTPTQTSGSQPDKPGSGGTGKHIDSDDKTAEMLALNEKISGLEQQMEALRLQLQLAPRPATTPAPTAVKDKPAKKPASIAPKISGDAGSDLPLPPWLLAIAGGTVAGGIGYLVYRRRQNG